MESSYLELESQALSLPDLERLQLAQRLWDSLEETGPTAIAAAETEALEAAVRRDRELQSGTVQARSHAEVMAAARNRLACK